MFVPTMSRDAMTARIQLHMCRLRGTVCKIEDAHASAIGLSLPRLSSALLRELPSNNAFPSNVPPTAPAGWSKCTDTLSDWVRSTSLELPLCFESPVARRPLLPPVHLHCSRRRLERTILSFVRATTFQRREPTRKTCL